MAAHNPMYSELPLATSNKTSVSSVGDCEYYWNLSATLFSSVTYCESLYWTFALFPFHPNAAKKLERGISRAIDNATVVNRARNELAMDFQGCDSLIELENISPGSPYYTFTIPDLSVYSEDFR